MSISYINATTNFNKTQNKKQQKEEGLKSHI